MLPFSRLAVIGLGLIGSSIARGVREHMPSVRVTAVGSPREAEDFARSVAQDVVS